MRDEHQLSSFDLFVRVKHKGSDTICLKSKRVFLTEKLIRFFYSKNHPLPNHRVIKIGFTNLNYFHEGNYSEMLHFGNKPFKRMIKFLNAMSLRYAFENNN